MNNEVYNEEITNPDTADTVLKQASDVMRTELTSEQESLILAANDRIEFITIGGSQ